MLRLNYPKLAKYHRHVITSPVITATSPQFLRLKPPFLKPISFIHSYSPRRPMENPINGDDYIHVTDTETSIENSNAEAEIEKPNYESDVIPATGNGNLSGGETENDQSNNNNNNNNNNYSYERKILPAELSRSVVTLTCDSYAEGGVCDVYLVGTAHVSAESCKEVEAVIDFLKPQVVFLELCSSRVAILTPQNLKVPTFGEMIEMWKKKQNPFGILYSWFLAKVASKLEVMPGAEFRVAYEEAKKYGGKVILGDRAVHITLRRTWAKMPLWHKTKLLYSLLFQAFFLPDPDQLTKMLKDMDDADMLTLVIQEMSKQFPTLMETLVHERDQYMSATLLKVASEHNSVVAVLGKGHLPGIQKHWKQPVEINQLLSIPSQNKRSISVRKIVASVGVAVAGVAIVSGIYLSTKKQ